MSKEITNVSVDILKVHPRNTEFFDDISGEEYEKFKKSIQEDGVLSPILVSPDMTIISGHQRTKAAKALGIKLVPVIIREDLTEESTKLKVLLAANFGRTKNDPVKQRKIAVEYVNLCGISHGTNNLKMTVDNRLSLSEIASQLGTSETSLKELLLIERKLTPELKEIIDSGQVTKTTASKLLIKLSPIEQEELISTLDSAKKYTQKQIEEYINQLKNREDEIATIESKLDKTSEKLVTKEQEVKELKDKIENISKQPPKVIEKIPEDYETLKQELKILERKAKLNEEEAQRFQKLKDDIQFMTKQKADIGRQIESATELAGLTVRLQKLLESELAPIKFKRCMEVLDTSDVATENLEEILSKLDSWMFEIRGYLSNRTVVDIVDIR